MKIRIALLRLFALTLFLSGLAGPVYAQATRTWVSGVGDDANPCSRTAPCKTFAGAISKTAAGGEINCIDPGGFGAVTITKAMTIDCANTEAGVLVAGTNGIIVNAGASDKVVLRGLDLIGTVLTPGLNGIVFNTGNALHVEKCIIREFTSAAPNGNGILYQPSGASLLFVTDTVLMNNSNTGINVRPTGAGGGKATIVRATVMGNTAGISVDTSFPTSGQIAVMVRDTTASGNITSGFASISTASSGTGFLMIDNSVSSLNTTGINAAGAHAQILVGTSTIWQNNTGLTVSGGGAISTFANNQVANPVNGSFTATFGLQ